MKKLNKWICFSLIMFLVSITSVLAVETKTNLKALGEMVGDTNGSLSFYVIGDYVFTSNYVSKNSLNLQDIMLAARSISLERDDGELKSTSAYGKMSILSASATQDRTGTITGWEFGKNLVGTTKLSNDAILNIKYIDYQPAKAVHVVTFKDDSDAVKDKQYVIDQKQASSPILDKKTGYDFVGWFKCTSAEDCSNVADSHDKFDLETTPITEDITLKAKWEIHKYNVTFDKDGGQGEVNDQKVSYNTNATRPSVVTKTGYDFQGWFKCMTEDCSRLETSAFDFESTPITEDIKLKAKWEIHKYSVKFNLNGGSGNADEQRIEYNKKAVKPNPDPKQEGYRFLGWYLCTSPSNCENIETDHTSYNFETPIDKDIELKAKWEKIIYTVTFKGMIDGELNDKLIDKEKTITVEYPWKIDLAKIPTTDVEGYTFQGWYNAKGFRVDPSSSGYIVTENTELTGKWERNDLVVTFKKDDKSVYRIINIKYEDSIENENSELVHKNTDKYNNYEFQGWFKCSTDACDSHDSMPYNFAEDGKKVTSNLTLIAVYKQIVNTTAIMSDFTSNLSSKDFSAYDAGENNIIFNVINSDAKLNGDNFETFVNAMSNLLRVKNVKSVEIGYGSDSVELKITEIRTQLQNLITTLSKKEISEGKMTDLLAATFTIKITLNDNYTNTEDNDNVTYTVKFASDKFVLVSSEEELNRELTSGKEIIIENSFAINKAIDISNNVVIDGDGNEITSNIKDSKYAINITGGNVTIKDLTLNISVYLPSEYDKETNSVNVEKRNTIGIYVGDDATLTISKLTVNGGKEVDKNNLKIGDEFYSSTNIAINVNAAIELRGTLKGSSLSYTTEIYGSPAILIPKEASAKVNIGGVHHQKYIYSFTRKNEQTDSIDSYNPIKDYEHYYVDYDSSYFTLAWYVMPNNRKFMFFYLYNEYLILPEAFKETGSNYTYIENGKTYELKTWNIKDGKQGITSEELIQEQVKNNNTYYIYGSYSQKN